MEHSKGKSCASALVGEFPLSMRNRYGGVILSQQDFSLCDEAPHTRDQLAD